MIRRLSIAVLLAVALGAAVGAQDFWGRGRMRVNARFPTEKSFDGQFNFCRLYYRNVRRTSSGQGWSTDYPDADINFTIRLSELTKTRVSRQASGEVNHLVIAATDPGIFKCPFLLMEDAGSAEFTDEEVAGLRDYLVKGGFLWVDDFWGEFEWQTWIAQLSRVLDPRHYPVIDLKADHPIFRTHFTVKRVPQIPSIQRWRRMDGGTSELGDESAEVHVRGVSDRKGHLMVLITHNTDIADAWEREGEDPRFFFQFSPEGYAVGINVLMYAMTH